MKKIFLIFLLHKLFLFNLYANNFSLEIRLLFYLGDGQTLTLNQNNITLKNNQFNYNQKIYSIQKNKFLMVLKEKPIKIKNINYFGKIKILKKNQKYFFINYLPLESYLQGVVSGEISYSWPAASIKAQAVASRSYAVYLIKKNKQNSYDIINSESNQVFRSLDKINPHITKNVLATQNIIMTYRNEPIQTFFHATCGGMTEKAEDVWPSENRLRYFKNIRCHYCKTHPKYSWEYKINSNEFRQKIANQLNIKKVKKIKVIKKSPTGRIKEVMVENERKKKYYITGNQLRFFLNPGKLLSTKFKITKRNNQFIFKGNGFGHGVGLCQWGAKTMAERRFNYKQILNFYYKNITIKPIKRQLYLTLK